MPKYCRGIETVNVGIPTNSAGQMEYQGRGPQTNGHQNSQLHQVAPKTPYLLAEYVSSGYRDRAIVYIGKLLP